MISARVTDQSVIEQVTQFEGYQTTQMTFNDVSDKYEADTRANFFDKKYDVMYLIEAMDTKGDGSMYPDLDEELPYIMIHLNRGLDKKLTIMNNTNAKVCTLDYEINSKDMNKLFNVITNS